jgi:cytochrome P450
MIAATTGLIRLPIPGSKMWRGVRARRKLADYFSAEIPHRRHSDTNDLLSKLCQASEGETDGFTDQEIIDHMNFFLVAAHDTVTSTLTAMIYYLGKFPEWQQKMRYEFLEYAQKGKPCLEQANLTNLAVSEMVFKETLRLHPPIPGIPRVAIKSFIFDGHFIPAGTPVGINPLFTHRMEEIWPNPDEFDPTHFTKEKIAQRHVGAWIPFGGGAHKCIGLRVAEMEAKAFFYHLLLRYRIVLRENYTCAFKAWPLAKPVDDLPITLIPLDAAAA